MSSVEALKSAWRAYDDQQYAVAAHIARSILQAERGNIVAAACLAISEYWLKPESDQVVPTLKKLIKREPKFAMLYMHLGAVYSHRGDMQNAQAAFEAAEGLSPEDPQNFFNLTSVKKYTAFDDVCERMLAMYDDGIGEKGILATVCFGLAKVYDDLGDHEHAMKFCMEGNAAQDAKFAPFRTTQHLGAVRELNKNGRFADLPTSGVSSDAPLFIVGMPRSGTSLVETILGRHPQVRTCGEMREGSTAESRLVAKYPALRHKQAPGVDLLEVVQQSDLAEESNSWLDIVADKSGGRYKRFTDKMPGNAVRLGLLSKLFPNSRIVYMRRNALDCCVSNLFARFGPAHAYTTRQDWLGGYFRYVEEVVAAWREIIELPVLEVHYEELVADPETQTRRMLEFAGLKWDAASLDHTQGRNDVRTASVWQARQPINKQSVDRWRLYEPWIQELIEALGGYEALGVERGDF